jgi:trehalose/maltose hydrolase-like predicted phosphorylase
MAWLVRRRAGNGPSPGRLARAGAAGVALGLAALVATPRAAAQDPAADPAFVLATADPARTPSPFIGNGHFGVTVPPLGVGASPSLVAGLYEHGPLDVPRIAAAPAWNAIAVFDGEQWLDSTALASGSIQSYRQSIDMRTATARTEYDWVDGSRRTSVRVETFVSRADPHLAVVQLALVPHTAGPLRVRVALAKWPPPTRLPLDTLTRTERSWGPAELWYPGHSIIHARTAKRSPFGARLTMVASPDGRIATLGLAAEVAWPKGATARADTTLDSARVEIAIDAAAGQTYTITEIVSIVPSFDDRSSLAAAVRDAASARVAGVAALTARNAESWQRLWETDIEIQGDTSLQRVVRSMLFYLLCSADSGTRLAIPPMGLSTAGYYGHVFWDSDTWMFPALVLTHPNVARSLVDFRSRALGAAEERARSYGFRGAMYPWESDEVGRETTPHFASQNAHSEIHVTGDVALAQWQYFLATGDSAWLARRGFPVIRETANFWVSRATYDSSRDRYDIKNVVSVAEGLVGVTDDAYTNAVARRNLQIATMASRQLGMHADPRWAAVAAKLHMPMDSATHSYRTYEGAPDSTLGVITPLLSYPLGVPMSDTIKRTHLEQAMRRMGDEAAGAMMGVTLLSVDAAELGDRALVDSLLPFSYRAHVHGPFLMLSETPTNKAFDFLTGAGGFLQQVIFGYTGMRLGVNGLVPEFPAILPSHITKLVLHDIHVRGKEYDIIVDASGRRMVPHRTAQAP